MDPGIDDNTTASIFNPITAVPKPPLQPYYLSSLSRTAYNLNVSAPIEQLEDRDKYYCCIDDFYNYDLLDLIPDNITYGFTNYTFGPKFTVYFTGKTQPPRVTVLADGIPLQKKVPFKKKGTGNYETAGR